MKPALTAEDKLDRFLALACCLGLAVLVASDLIERLDDYINRPAVQQTARAGE